MCNNKPEGNRPAGYYSVEGEVMSCNELVIRHTVSTRQLSSFSSFQSVSISSLSRVTPFSKQIPIIIESTIFTCEDGTVTTNRHQ